MDAKERTRLRALRKRADGSWRLLTADDVDSDKDIAENGCTFVADLGATDVRHRRCWSIVGPLNIVAMPHEIGALIVGAVNALPALLDALDAAEHEGGAAWREGAEAMRRDCAAEVSERMSAAHREAKGFHADDLGRDRNEAAGYALEEAAEALRALPLPGAEVSR